MLTVVGGVYRERCMHPHWDEVYGSAGRAASAIARLGGEVHLHCHLDALSQDVMAFRTSNEGFKLTETAVPQGGAFHYAHGLERPHIRWPSKNAPDLSVAGDKVLRYGMLDSTAVVAADYAVFDPQNVHGPESFRANGSSANHLALVLNRYEAGVLVGERGLPAQVLAERLAEQEDAEVVVIKMGPQGALVWHEGTAHRIPAYETPRVWKIGSGDQFAANFAYAWMEEGRSPAEAADRASRATAFYCQHRGFPTLAELDDFHPDPIGVSDRFVRGDQPPRVYLAGPFFTLGQLWVVEQARNCLRDAGLSVFSPYHDVGPGRADEVVPLDLDGIRECDLVLAIADGMDPGTIFEVGYARREGRPVVMYVENEPAEDAKMMVGSGCYMRSDFVSAIYQTVWVGAKL